jgi:hypothetical protein
MCLVWMMPNSKLRYTFNRWYALLPLQRWSFLSCRIWRFLLAVVLSVLQFVDSDYSFGMFTLLIFDRLEILECSNLQTDWNTTKTWPGRNLSDFCCSLHYPNDAITWSRFFLQTYSVHMFQTQIWQSKHL